MNKKEALIKAAEHLFAEKGFRETSMVDLCQATGVAEGTIFYHFKSKEGLFLVVLERIVHEIIAGLGSERAVADGQDGLAQLESAIGHYLNLADELGPRYLLLHRHDVYELAQANERCRRSLEEFYNFLLDLFEQPLERGMRDGSVRRLSARKTSFILFALLDGITRLQTFNLYESGSLFSELLASCRQMVQS